MFLLLTPSCMYKKHKIIPKYRYFGYFFFFYCAFHLAEKKLFKSISKIRLSRWKVKNKWLKSKKKSKSASKVLQKCFKSAKVFQKCFKSEVYFHKWFQSFHKSFLSNLILPHSHTFVNTTTAQLNPSALLHHAMSKSPTEKRREWRNIFFWHRCIADTHLWPSRFSGVRLPVVVVSRVVRATWTLI